jgi:hypothetical protein
MPVQRDVDASADAHLEHAIARLDGHPLDRVDTARMERRTECDVVEPGDVLVDAGYQIVIDDARRQRPCRSVGPDNLFAFTSAMRLK